MRLIKSQPKRSGFTLIELLVVIGIIALLAGILLPVYSQAREKARQTNCLSNLEQLGKAIDQYKMDNSGVYPDAQIQPAPTGPPVLREGSFVSWPELVYPYVKNGKVVAPNGVKYSGGVFHCPDDEGSNGPSYAINAWVLFDFKESQETFSADTVLLAEKKGLIPQAHFVWWQIPWPAWPPTAGSTIADKEDAINAITIGAGEQGEHDVDDPRHWRPEPAQQIIEAAGLQTRRHTGGANYLFMDGHVKWARLVDLWGNGVSTNEFWPTRTGK